MTYAFIKKCAQSFYYLLLFHYLLIFPAFKAGECVAEFLNKLKLRVSFKNAVIKLSLRASGSYRQTNMAKSIFPIRIR